MIGIPLCVKWKLKGLAAALSCLFALSLFSYQYLDLDQRYWHVGMAIAMAFSFVILTLSLEEVESLVDKMQRESQSRLDNFLLLDDTAKRAEEAWSVERSTLASQIATLSQELTQVLDEKQVFYKLAQLAKDELLQMRTQQELLQQDLIYKKQQISQLNEKLEGTEITLQELIDSDSERKIICLEESLEQSLQLQAAYQAQVENALQEKESCINQLKMEEEVHKEQAAAFSLLQSERDRLSENLNRLQIQISIIEEEKEQLQENLSVMRLQYEKIVHSENNCKQNLQEQVGIAKEFESKFSRIEQELAGLKESKLLLENQLIQSKLDGQKKVEWLEVKLTQTNQDLVSKIEMLEKADDTANKLIEELKGVNREVGILTNINAQLNQMLGSLNNELECKKAEFISLQYQVEDLEKFRETIPQVDSNARRVECMYEQLKIQFQEKSFVLDQTRRELFLAEEKALAIQKKLEELEIYSQTESEALLLKEFTGAVRDFEKAKCDYENEIQELQELVSLLLT